MYLKWTNELGYDGHTLPKLMNYKVIRSSHIDILRNNSIFDYSYTYNILSHLSISGDCRYASLLTMAVTMLLWEAVTLLIKL